MAESNAVLQAMRDRRSIRSFMDEAVTRDELVAILEAGRWAPSGKNNQAWRFLAVRKDDPRAGKLAECTVYTPVVQAADTLICVFLEKAAMYSPVKDWQGAGACIQNMLLAVHSLGLGAVWIGEILNREEDVKDILGLDNDSYELMAVLAVGHPDKKGASSRKPLEELLLEDIE